MITLENALFAMTAIDRSSPVPLYFQLKQLLMGKIQGGDWTPGTLIPSELELQETYSLSRTTVRQTLSELVNEGYLTRQRGRGTFITQPKIAYDPSRGIQINEYMDEYGVEMGWRVLEQGWVNAAQHVADALNVRAGTRVFCLQRLRLAGQEVIGYHLAYTPERIAARINSTHVATGDSLHYLNGVIKEVRIERTLEATLAHDRDRKLLSVERNSPILQMDGVVMDNDGAVLEYLYARFRGDRFRSIPTIRRG
jgi:GntR family transcriptional regulator